jgi:hypothetical protein
MVNSTSIVSIALNLVLLSIVFTLTLVDKGTSGSKAKEQYPLRLRKDVVQVGK